MKIAEMEAGHDAYIGLEDRIRTMVAGREFPAVFSVCVACSRMLSRQSSIGNIGASSRRRPISLSFNVICKYAPLAF